jgi:hypothetical protein
MGKYGEERGWESKPKGAPIPPLSYRRECFDDLLDIAAN